MCNRKKNPSKTQMILNISEVVSQMSGIRIWKINSQWKIFMNDNEVQSELNCPQNPRIMF